jgi:hypothetical protein
MIKPPRRLAGRPVSMLAALVIVLLLGHGAVLYYVSSHVVLSAAVVSGAIIFLVIKHVGLLGPLYALFRRAASRGD